MVDMCGRIEKYLLSKIKQEGAIHLSLLDPEKVNSREASQISKDAEKAGTTAIMIGGSTVTNVKNVDAIVKAVKTTVKIPVILFPNDVAGVSQYADALWFMSLLNSSNPYFITGAQAVASMRVKEYNIEPIPLGYIITGEGGAAGLIGQAHPVQYNKPTVAAAYALAAQYLGMRFIYLEAGSGARVHVPPEMIIAVKRLVRIPLIVGGGIRTGSDAGNVVKAGADAVVTGTVVEKTSSVKDKISELVQSIKEAAERR